MALKVSEVARLAGVSVRTLHHYDEIGLVRPSGRSDAGYRLYAPADLERLQQVLFFRELGFPLDAVRRIVGDPGFDVAAALRMQRRLLSDRLARTQALIEAVDAAIDAHEEGRTMSDEERFEVFGADDPAQYEEEAKARWGHTEAWRESKRRAKAYGKAEWARIKAEGDAIFADLARLAEAGRPPSSREAMAVAERHRAHVERWFYPCAPAMHRGLGDLYVDDPRFAATLDRFRPGLATYARDAWHANADRAAP